MLSILFAVWSYCVSVCNNSNGVNSIQFVEDYLVDCSQIYTANTHALTFHVYQHFYSHISVNSIDLSIRLFSGSVG